MSNKLYKKHNVDIIRLAFNEARAFLDKGAINMLEYRSLLSTLLSEVKEIDKNYNDENIREILNELIDNEKDSTKKI